MTLESVTSVKSSVTFEALELVSVDDTVSSQVFLRTQSSTAFFTLELVNLTQMYSVDVFRESRLSSKRACAL
jgi:hypothetical protein